jgi:Cu(I)/Ag(I) efflux system membrane fusion protein
VKRVHSEWIGKSIAFVVLAAAVLAAGYWWGSTRPQVPEINPSELDSSDRATMGKTERKTQGKILYYRNPMGQPDTSPVPKKDPMGMDYLPVYEGEEPVSGDSVVKISIEKIQKLGVKTEAAVLRELTRTVRAVSTVQPDERRLSAVAPRFEGWIQRLHVNTTGQSVKKGEALIDVYSPELITAQHEYLVARKGTQLVEGSGLEVQANMERLAESALQRLRNWEIPEADLRMLKEEGHIRQHLTLRSPASGVVLEKSAIQGQRFMPGEMLYQIVDLSTVWMLAKVFEQDLTAIHRGQTATIRIDAYPDKVFNGKVTFIYPTVDPETRTAQVRIELQNTQGLLKPAMYGRVELATSRNGAVLAVPDSAVLDTGTRQLVLVDLGQGRFEPRMVKLGLNADNYVEVQDGLKAGEMVVVKANFLIDAESNLKAALSGFGNGTSELMSNGRKENQQMALKSPTETPSSSVSPSPSMNHYGDGTVEAIDLANATVTLAHGPVASLGWPPMTMDFLVRDRALLKTLRPGQKIRFKLTRDSDGAYVILKIQIAEVNTAASPPINNPKGY